LRLSSGPDAQADPEAIAAALLDAVRSRGIDLLPWSAGATALRRRAAYAGVPLEEMMADRLDEWLPPLLAGRRRLDAIPAGALTD
ncbi:hypothetical protein ACPXCV_27420, partial [Escherichia coli]